MNRIVCLQPPLEFLRTMQWSFENLNMLVGNDMPIFGGSTHPCVSLRLRCAARVTSSL